MAETEHAFGGGGTCAATEMVALGLGFAELLQPATAVTASMAATIHTDLRRYNDGRDVAGAWRGVI